MSKLGERPPWPVLRAREGLSAWSLSPKGGSFRTRPWNVSYHRPGDPDRAVGAIAPHEGFGRGRGVNEGLEPRGRGRSGLRSGAGDVAGAVRRARRGGIRRVGGQRGGYGQEGLRGWTKGGATRREPSSRGQKWLEPSGGEARVESSGGGRRGWRERGERGARELRRRESAT